jgi:O-antigen/teichoic acid export membrane protein
MSNDRKMFGGFLGGIIVTASNFAVSFIQFRILLRHLPIEQAGIWIIFLNIGAYILSLDMGLSPTLGREISFLSGNPVLTPSERAFQIGSLVRSCTTVVTVLAAVVVVAGSTVGWVYLRTIVPVAIASESRTAWMIFIAGAALNLVGEGWFAGLYGLGQVFHERIIRALGLLLGLLYMAVAIYFGASMHALAIAYVAQGATTVIMARHALSRVGTDLIAKGRFEFAVIRRLALPSLKYAATLLGAILILQTDNLVIASTLGASSVPNYQAGAKLITALMSLSMMLVVTSTPFISRAYAQGDLDELKRLLNRNLRYTLSVMVVLGSFIACFADKVILLWLGQGHFVGFGVIWVLLIVMLLESHHVAMASATMASGKIVFFVPALLAGFLNLVFSITLAKRFGVMGVACGTLFAQILTNNWFAPWYTIRLFKLSVRDHLWQVVLPVIGFIAFLLIVDKSVSVLSGSWNATFSLAAGMFATAAAGLLYFNTVMITPTERKQLGGKIRALARRKAQLPSVIEKPSV